MLGEVVSGLSIWDRLFKFWKNRNRPELESVATRFVHLFESHGVHRNQIPRFIGFDLTIADVKDDKTLLLKLSEKMLDAACEMFAVRREWLDGAESQIHPYHDFYKHPKWFEDFLLKINAGKTDWDVSGVLVAPDGADRDSNALQFWGQYTYFSVSNKYTVPRYQICRKLQIM